ncbi:MAG: hypothetical protein IJ568_03645 [Bacilli bacterium]|nr:hypothetical protein [Bacilli bacterium]
MKKENKNVVEDEKTVKKELAKLKKEELKALKNDKNEMKSKRLLRRLEIIIVLIFIVIMLVLLCNRTFFRNKYKTSKISLSIPTMMFFVKDDGNELVMKTLRKTQYVKEFFAGELQKLTRYNCDGYSFYYIDETKTAIYTDIYVTKNHVVKTVTVNYAQGDADCLCNAHSVGKRAEEICKK